MQDEESGMRPSKAKKYVGWQESLDLLQTALTQHHPVHGLLGNALIGNLCLMKHWHIVGLSSQSSNAHLPDGPGWPLDRA